MRIARAERDGTRAETRIRLFPKRTSPFKSVGASVQSTAGSRGMRISSSNGNNAGQTTFRGKVELYWLPTPFACFPFTSPPVRYRVTPGSERALHPYTQTLTAKQNTPYPHDVHAPPAHKRHRVSLSIYSFMIELCLCMPVHERRVFFIS